MEAPVRSHDEAHDEDELPCCRQRVGWMPIGHCCPPTGPAVTHTVYRGVLMPESRLAREGAPQNLR